MKKKTDEYITMTSDIYKENKLIRTRLIRVVFYETFEILRSLG